MESFVRAIFFGIFAIIWSFLGFFFWILILGRVVVYIGIRLFSALFSNASPPEISDPMMQQISAIYPNGFKKIYRTCFKKNESDEEVEIIPLSITSFYELLATLFITYLSFGLLFPDSYLPGGINAGTLAVLIGLGALAYGVFKYYTSAGDDSRLDLRRQTLERTNHSKKEEKNDI